MRWSDTRAEVWARDAGHCVACGLRLDYDSWQCHHRRLRAQGGDDRFSNLVALCMPCHADAHSRRLEFGSPRGLILSHGEAPDETPVARFDPWAGDLALSQPDDYGSWLPCTG